MHELGHALYLRDEANPDSLMNSAFAGGSDPEPDRLDFAPITYLALAPDDATLRARLTVIGIVGTEDPMAAIEEILKQEGDVIRGRPREDFENYKDFLERNAGPPGEGGN